MDAVIIGGGFFGLYLAEQLAIKGCSVTVLEKESELMSRASYVNQARVHNGYHYPRSSLTAVRSQASFPRFVDDFRDAIKSDYESYYMIGNQFSKVSSKQFEVFCQRVGIPCEIAPARIRNIVNPRMIEACYATTEFAFDSYKLQQIIVKRAESAGVKIILSANVTNVSEVEPGCLMVRYEESGVLKSIEGRHVFNCTYADINKVLKGSSVDLTPMKYERVEMCLVKPPVEIADSSITVMCGPFFSIMPFPSTPWHSFSHVRYTPHLSWSDKQELSMEKEPLESAWKYMKLDAARFIPILSECQYQGSIWETKTILPSSEKSDSRPILFLNNHGFDGFHTVMGGKIDNVYDVIEYIERSGVLNEK